MKRILKIFLIVIVVVVLAFVVVVALRPADFRVTRSAIIAAPPDAVFAQVNNLHNWTEWSPWAKLDPDVKNTFEGPASGVGATFAWAGNNRVGEGRMAITESKPNESIQMKLEFLKPIQAVNIMEFTLKPDGDRTVVTWSMFGKNNFMSKAVSLFMNYDQLIGEQFQKGMTNLNSVLQTAPQK